MLRKPLYVLTIVAVILSLSVGCAGPPAAPAEPTATTEVVVPPVISEEEKPEATPTPKPTAEPEEPAEEEPAAEVEPFKVNGVTMPFNRAETVVMDQVNFAVFDSFNPFIPNGVEFAAGWWQISQEYLWYVNYATGEVIPWLAESHEYSEDYQTLTIHIRKGATWNDGVPFTAHDVAFTMNMLMEDETLYGPGDMQYWDEVYAADDYTVVFEMNEPRPRQHLLFWCKICTGQTIVPKHIWEEVDPHTFKNNPPVTTGPYMFDTAYPEQKVMVWKRNDDYWGKDMGYEPAPKYVIYRTGPGAEQQLAEIQENNMDIFGMSYELYQERQADISQINYVAYVDPCPRGAFFNTAKEPHLSQPEFRRALSMLMNRPKWAENIWVPASKPAVAFWADYRNLDKFINEEANEKWGILEYNPERAMEIFEELGYTLEGDTLMDPDGEPVSFEVSTPSAPGGNEYMMAQDFIEDLKAVGIEASLQHYEQPVMFSNTRNGTFEIGFWWMCGATVDPTELFNGFTCDRVVPIGEETKRGNEMRLCDPELDAVLEELNAVDPEAPEAHDLYMEAYDLFMRDAPGVPLIQTYYTQYFNTTYWDNMMSNDNLYTLPFNWWGQIMFVLFNIEPAG
jgi:peptide/nickel transport system substrate-binding protein